MKFLQSIAIYILLMAVIIVLASVATILLFGGVVFLIGVLAITLFANLAGVGKELDRMLLEW